MENLFKWRVQLSKYTFRIYYAVKKRLIGSNPEEVFTKIYEQNVWGNPESASGDGSTLTYTENIRNEIPKLIHRLAVGTIFDAPCGDHNWFNKIRFELPVAYIGADIVSELIEANKTKFPSPAKQFIKCNIIVDPPPKADLWLCRDALFHFSDRDIFLTLNNFINSEIDFLLTSSHPYSNLNQDIYTGSFRSLNLELPPFGLPSPDFEIDDWIEGFPVRKLCLWDRPTIARSLSENPEFLKAVDRGLR